MPGLVVSAKQVFSRSEHVWSRYLNGVVWVKLVQFILVTVGSPDLLKKDQLWRDTIEEFGEVKVISVKALNVESYYSYF